MIHLFKRPYVLSVVALITAGALAALVVVVVGVFWFGWHETRQNRELLGTLPVYPGAEVVQDFPHASESDENPLTPPDKWVILVSYRVPEGTTGKEVARFYMDEMPPEWERCLHHASTYEPETGAEGVLFQGAGFVKGRLYVSVAIANVGTGERSYDVFIDRNREMRYHPCEPQRLALPGRPGRSGPPEFRPTPVPTFPPGMTEEEQIARAVLDCREVMDGDLETSLMGMFPDAGSLDDAKARFVRGDWASKEELEAMVDRYCPSRVAPPPP